VLSRSHADRELSAFGGRVMWRGFQIGCYACHNGPGSDDPSPNHPAVVVNAVASTPANTPLALPLQAADADGDPLTLRVVSQAGHGTVGLVGTAATYYPEADYLGGDSFTFARGRIHGLQPRDRHPHGRGQPRLHVCADAAQRRL